MFVLKQKTVTEWDTREEMCITSVWDDSLQHGNKTKSESELVPFSQFCEVNWIKRQFAGGTVFLLHKHVSVLLRVWSFCRKTPLQLLSDQSIVGRLKERMKLNWLMGRHVSPPHPTRAFLIISCFVWFWAFVFIVSSPLLRWNSAACLQRLNIQKVICCLMSVALCTINSLQQRPETHIVPSDSRHNRGKHNPASGVITNYSRISLNLLLFKFMPPKPLARYYPSCL